MSFLSFEKSKFKAAPIELYEFTLGSTIYRYTSTGRDTVDSGETYLAVPITRSELELSHDVLKSDITVTVARTNPVAQLFIPGPPDEIPFVTIFRLHKEDWARVAFWKGRVVSAMFHEDEVSLTCESYLTSLKRQGLRAKYQQLCNHVLFDKWCALDKNTYKVECASTTAVGRVMTHATLGSYADRYWNGGWAYRVSDGSRRQIIGHTGNDVTLAYAFLDVDAGGEEFHFWPGCDHTFPTCRDKFSNNINYGGFWWLPTDNPFKNVKSIHS